MKINIRKIIGVLCLIVLFSASVYVTYLAFFSEHIRTTLLVFGIIILGALVCRGILWGLKL